MIGADPYGEAAMAGRVMGPVMVDGLVIDDGDSRLGVGAAAVMVSRMAAMRRVAFVTANIVRRGDMVGWWLGGVGRGSGCCCGRSRRGRRVRGRWGRG